MTNQGQGCPVFWMTIMRMVHLAEINEEKDFALRAANHFANNPTWFTFTDEQIVPGCLFAIRYGIGNDCVVVLKLDDFHEPANYQQLIKTHPGDQS